MMETVGRASSDQVANLRGSRYCATPWSSESRYYAPEVPRAEPSDDTLIDTSLNRLPTLGRLELRPGEIVRPLVADVAYLSYATLPKNAAPEAFEVPLGAPTVAVEVLSPDDRPRDVEHKIATYLAAGTAIVLVVDPASATIAVHERRGERILTLRDTFSHEALPGFALDLAVLFERARR